MTIGIHASCIFLYFTLSGYQLQVSQEKVILCAIVHLVDLKNHLKLTE